MTVRTDQERIASLEHVVGILISALLTAGLMEAKDATELMKELVPDYGKPQKKAKP